MVYKRETVTIEKHIDGSIHVCNKNKRYILSKEINANEILQKSCILPLPPVAGESEKVMKEQFFREQESLKQEDIVRKLNEKTKEDEARHIRSRNRQLYHKEHGRLANMPKSASSNSSCLSLQI